MIMLNYLFLISVGFIEFLISYIVFSHIAERKRPIWQSFVFGAALFVSAVPINVLLSNNILVNGIYFAVINIAFALVFFYVSPIRAVFYSVVLDIFSTALEFATIVLFSMIYKVEIDDYNTNSTLLIIEGIASKTLYFIICLILIRLINKDTRRSPFPLSFYIYPSTVMVSLLSFWKMCLDETLSASTQLVFSVISVVLFGSTVFLFVTYQHNIEKDNKMITMQSELSRLQTEKSYYDILEHQDEQLLSYAHDTKNHLMAIKNLNKDPQIDSYLDEMSENLKSYSNVCRSGNIILDVILNKYITECKIKKIQFVHDVRITNLNNIEDYDLVTILGNLMDNAIEAAEKSVKRSVSLETDTRNMYNVIIVSNSCDIAPKVNGNKLITTKRDAPVHGLGMKNVLRSIKKYDGDLSWEFNYQLNQFKVTLMIR